MLIIATGGMKLKHPFGYFKIIIPTLQVLRDAKKTEGCMHADIFKMKDVFFTVSVWQSRQSMQAFAHNNRHGRLMKNATETMAFFYNHSEQCAEIPAREEIVESWFSAIAKRDGKGSVGRIELAPGSVS